MNERGKKEREEAGGEIMKKGGQSGLTDPKSLFYAFNIPQKSNPAAWEQELA